MAVVGGSEEAGSSKNNASMSLSRSPASRFAAPAPTVGPSAGGGGAVLAAMLPAILLSPSTTKPSGDAEEEGEEEEKEGMQAIGGAGGVSEAAPGSMFEIGEGPVS